MFARGDIRDNAVFDFPLQIQSFTTEIEVPGAEVLLVADIDGAEIPLIVPSTHSEHQRVWNLNDWYLLQSVVGDCSAGSPRLRAQDQTTVQLLDCQLDLSKIWTEYGDVVPITIESYHAPNFGIQSDSGFVRWRDTGDRIILVITISLHSGFVSSAGLLGLLLLSPTESSVAVSQVGPEITLAIGQRDDAEVLEIGYNSPGMIDGFGSYFVFLPSELTETLTRYPSLNKSEV